MRACGDAALDMLLNVQYEYDISTCTLHVLLSIYVVYNLGAADHALPPTKIPNGMLDNIHFRKSVIRRIWTHCPLTVSFVSPSAVPHRTLGKLNAYQSMKTSQKIIRQALQYINERVRKVSPSMRYSIASCASLEVARNNLLCAQGNKQR